MQSTTIMLTSVSFDETPIDHARLGVKMGRLGELGHHVTFIIYSES